MFTRSQLVKLAAIAQESQATNLEARQIPREITNPGYQPISKEELFARQVYIAQQQQKRLALLQIAKAQAEGIDTTNLTPQGEVVAWQPALAQGGSLQDMQMNQMALHIDPTKANPYMDTPLALPPTLQKQVGLISPLERKLIEDSYMLQNKTMAQGYMLTPEVIDAIAMQRLAKQDTVNYGSDEQLIAEDTNEDAY